MTRQMVEVPLTEIAERGQKICELLNLNGIEADETTAITILAIGVSALRYSGVRMEEISRMTEELFQRVSPVMEESEGN